MEKQDRNAQLPLRAYLRRSRWEFLQWIAGLPKL